MRDLNEKQMRFAEAYVLGETAANGAASAVAAGFAADCAKQTAWRLLRHEGIRREIDRLTRESLADHAVASVRFLGSVVRNETEQTKLRIDAAKVVLSIAGYVAPKAPEPMQEIEKSIEGMSLAELDAALDAIKAKNAQWDAAMIDITPAPGTIDVEAAAESDPPAAG